MQNLIVVAGLVAPVFLIVALGYLLKKIKEGVLIDTLYSWENLDYIALHGQSMLLFVIAFPRYPHRAIEIAEYAKKYRSQVVCLSDSLKSPIINLADHYVVIDMEGFSFVDPFSHIITFLGALVHEIAYIDKDATARRLSRIEDGVRRRQDFFQEETDKDIDYDPLKIEYYNNT